MLTTERTDMREKTNKTNKTNKTLKMLVILISSLLLFPLTTQAEKSNNQGGAPGFLYEIKKPANQQGDPGYFDLLMKAKQKQTVQLILKNPSDQDVTVEVNLNSAKTNMHGVMEYGPTKLKNDQSLIYDFADVVKGPKKVTVPKKSEKELPLEITMPAESFKGKIVGGIQLQKSEDETQLGQVKGATVLNKYAYVIAMVLSESQETILPELELNKLVPGQANYRNVIYGDFSNVTAEFLNDLSIDVKIMSVKNADVLYEKKKAGMRMAPNSQMLFPISLEGKKMLPGVYRGQIVATAGEQKWEWEEKFEITDEEADKYNQLDVSLVQDKSLNWLVIILIVGVIVGLSLLAYFIVKKISQDANQKKQRPNKRRKKRH